MAERRHRAIGAHKQRQDVETLSTVGSLQPRSRPDRRLDALLHLTRTPRQSIHQRFSVDAESGVKLEQAGERSSGDHLPAPIVNLHDTIAEEALRPTRSLVPSPPRHHAIGGGIRESEWRRRERENLCAGLQLAEGRIYGSDGAAEILGVKPTTLISRLKALGLRTPYIRRRSRKA